MKALVWQGPHRMAVEEAPEPEPPPGWVVLHPAAAGVCGSEIEGYVGRQANRVPPLVMGHELAGEVVDVGQGVQREWIGRRAAVNPIVGCGSCEACQAGATNLCASRGLIGVQHPGGFASYVVAPATNLVELPEGFDARLGALIEPMANGVRAVRLGLALGPVRRAVILGAGTIGIGCLQAALAERIPTVQVVEPHQGRRQHAVELGAGSAFESAAEMEPGAGLVIDAVGASATRQAALGLVRPGGVCVFIGLHDRETSLVFADLVRNQVTIRGTYAYTREEFRLTMELLASGRLGIGALSPVLPLERGPEVFAELAAGPSSQVKVFLADV